MAQAVGRTILSVSVPAEAVVKIRQIAEREDRKVSQVVRRLLLRGLDANETPAEGGIATN